ncbi:MAG: prepilin-type N-terminal cleavage/methylation domain-containing protein [Phycisphaerae bacterium]|nr:prepilin-type N-terminal cleavage/methylation domain-containing protein [Phycisphaerae bacterium]
MSRAFTLAELLVAMVVMALVVGTTAAALSQLFRSKNRIESRRGAFERAHTAAARVAQDAVTLARDHDLRFARVRITSGANGSDLLMLCRSREPVRGIWGEAEGPEFEIQYKVLDDGSGPELWRRADPAFDPALDAGGVAEPVSDGIVAFDAEAFDGQSWQPAWDSDAQGLPYGLRVTVVASGGDGQVTSTARRVIAIERVPAPKPEPTDSGSTSSRGSGAAQ